MIFSFAISARSSNHFKPFIFFTVVGRETQTTMMLGKLRQRFPLTMLPLLNRIDTFDGHLNHFFSLSDEYELPPGLTLIINFFTLHRRKDIWGEDADKFNPDHFLPENVEKRPAYSFLPFSGGQRNCIGESAKD